MQYRATVNNIVHHSLVQGLFAHLDKHPEASTDRPKISSFQSNEWHQMNDAAAATSDFWVRMVGWPGRHVPPPLDR